MSPLILFGIKQFITHAVKSRTMRENAVVGAVATGMITIEGLQDLIPPQYWPILLVVVNVWNMYRRSVTKEPLSDK